MVTIEYEYDPRNPFGEIVDEEGTSVYVPIEVVKYTKNMCSPYVRVEDLPRIARMNRWSAGKAPGRFAIKKLIFNPPATVVLWEDGSKTVVKCSKNDIFDEEKGLAMAIAKKALGNTSAYYEVVKDHCVNLANPETDWAKFVSATTSTAAG